VNPGEPHIASLFGLHLSPPLALLLTVAFVVFLFRRDIREQPNLTGALWLPLVWMLLVFSRGASQWLAIFGFPGFGASALEEGSLLDACVYLVLIVAGLYVLHQRQASLSEIVRNNQWLTIFLLYCLFSIVWSDFPFVAFKRWIKILGHPIMVLVVLTEPDAEEALKRLMKRCAYVVVPVSILFIKYYPQWGRGFDPWTGAALNYGIAQGKNMLGADCLILGFFFFWHLLQIWRTKRSKARRNELLLTAAFLFMIWWLFSMAHSATSLVSLFIGGLMLLFVGMRSVNKNFVGSYILAGIVLFAVAEITFGFSRYLVAALGKDPTLTGRTELWQQLFGFDTNPLFGVGFESFWLGERMRKIAELVGWHANEAHNGYLEIYLTLGLLGVFILLALIIATFWKIRRELWRNFEWGRFRLGFLAAVVVYNWTEAGFKTLHPMWFMFYIIAVELPRPPITPVHRSFELARSEDDMEFVSA
jgi:exopolysaccharide production protein ExoQ